MAPKSLLEVPNIGSPGLYQSTSTSSSYASLSPLLNNQPEIVSESLTLDSIASLSSILVPPFPREGLRPVVTILDLCDNMLHDYKPANRKGSQKTQAVLTSPTPPRLKSMLKETLCITKWVENIPQYEAPGHTPWNAPTGFGTSSSWVAEGSIFSPDFFSETLSKARKSYNTMRKQQPPTSSPMPPAKICNRHLASQRPERNNAPPRELGHRHHLSWSLQVPINKLPKENSPIFNSRAQTDASGATYADCNSQEYERGPLPSLMISNSHATLPLSLDSAGNLMTLPPTLAVRRGKKNLPPLRSKAKGLLDTPYPNIPTAFLGSPSSYSPKFEHADCNNDVSMDIEEMIYTLRKQCSSLTLRTPLSDIFDHGTLVNNSLSPLSSSDCSDFRKDWSLSDSSFNTNETSYTLNETSHSINMPASKYTDRRVSLCKIGRPSIARHEDSPQILRGIIKSNQRENTQSVPLVVRPALVSSLSSRKSTTKSPKSVRFAFLPGKDVDPDSSLPVYPPDPHGSSVPAKMYASNPPPIIKADHKNRPTPARQVISEVIVPPITATTKVREDSRMRQDVLPNPLDGQRNIIHKIMHEKSRSVEGQRPLQNTPSQNHKSSTKPEQQLQSTSKSFGRRSLSYLVRTPNAGKENKSDKTKSFLSSSSRKRWSMNENALRRSNTNTESTPAPMKSRMPIPFRSILTRFNS